jgi:hypothetical protein
MSSERELVKKSSSSKGTELIALGAGMGAAIGAGAGVAFGDISMGAGVGVALGAGVGAAVMEYRKAKK